MCQIIYLPVQIKLIIVGKKMNCIRIHTIMQVTWRYLSGPVTNPDFQSDHLKLLPYRQLQYLRSSQSNHHHIQPMPRIKDDYKFGRILIKKSLDMCYYTENLIIPCRKSVISRRQDVDIFQFNTFLPMYRKHA
jgi:hypothetical protein